MFFCNVQNFSEWRLLARRALRYGLSPDSIVWQHHSDAQASMFDVPNNDLFTHASSNDSCAPSKTLSTTANVIDRQMQQMDAFCEAEGITLQHISPRIPRAFVPIAEYVACYRSDDRWHLLYRIAWRLIFDNPQLLGFASDPDIARLKRTYKAVSRSRHKMKAFVRFNRLELSNERTAERKQTTLLQDVQASVENTSLQAAKSTLIGSPTASLATQREDAPDEYYVAWFEPEHAVLELTADFFVERFSNMHWSIYTPDGAAHWNARELTFTYETCQREANLNKTCADASAKASCFCFRCSQGVTELLENNTLHDDAADAWLLYYANIFNPHRLKMQAMQSEMPKKYWKNLPEAMLIPSLEQQALNLATQKAERQAEKTVTSKHIDHLRAQLRESKSAS